MGWNAAYLDLRRIDPTNLGDVEYPDGARPPEPPLILQLAVQRGIPPLDTTVIGYHCRTRILRVDQNGHGEWVDRLTSDDWLEYHLYAPVHPLDRGSEWFDSDAAILIHWRERGLRHPCRCRVKTVRWFAVPSMYRVFPRPRYRFTKTDREMHRMLHRSEVGRIMGDRQDPPSSMPEEGWFLGE